MWMNPMFNAVFPMDGELCIPPVITMAQVPSYFFLNVTIRNLVYMFCCLRSFVLSVLLSRSIDQCIVKVKT